jgi:hypothetical protein
MSSSEIILTFIVGYFVGVNNDTLNVYLEKGWYKVKEWYKK